LRQGLHAGPLRCASVRSARFGAGEDMARSLATRGEEFPQQSSGLLLADARIDLGPVQALRLLEHASAVGDRAALGIVGAVVEARDPRMNDRARAHRAGFEG